jgi:glucose-6-phosphate-specific signal transduction histidine kinase
VPARLAVWEPVGFLRVCLLCPAWTRGSTPVIGQMVMEHVAHAFATIVIPAGLTLGLVFWCAEFYHSKALRKPWYWALVVTTASCMALTTALFVTGLV